MTPFLKLTPETCQRMWRHVRFKTLKTTGMSLTYQMEPKWLHLIMGFRNNANYIQDTTAKLKIGSKA